VKRRREKRSTADKTGEIGASETDVEHFERAMADVVRLAPDPRGRVRAAPHISAPRAAVPSTLSSAGQDSHRPEADFAAPGVDRRELRRLRRGEHAAGSRLDLHGLTAAEAVARVKRFIDEGRHRHRCVCIVHGRGLHSAGNISILKAAVRDCLSRHPAVLAYADAPRADGGTGAVYVLLRK